MTSTVVRSGPKSSADWIAIEQATFMPNRRPPMVIERGQGSRVWDVEGREYLDLIAGIAVVSLGHSSPVVQRALADQSARLIHISNLYYSIPQLELAQLLMDHSPFDKVFFCNSGAEANEGALKLARKWGKRNRNGAFGIITAEHAFHGRTLATVTATGKESYTRSFTPLPEGFKQVPLNDMDALERAVDATTAAVFLEPIQGESGVHMSTQDYLRDVRDFCRDQGLLFMLDEVQTGIGRLGTLFGFERWGVEPDIATLAKGLGGGVPIGAVVAKDAAAVFEPGDHGSTFGGNPLMCAVARDVVTYILENDVLGNVNRVGSALKRGLEAMAQQQPLIESVRGEGLLLAVELRAERAPDIVRLGIEEGVLLNATGPTTIRLAPPLTLSEAEAEEALDKIARAFSRLDAPEVTQPTST
ncbi:MAG: acetylornithine transaminase [Chloroflexi bacterium]|nr:acetylornithine transaminase [Chloroflexota bacterium]MBV9894877.1 acetylornithine transaminase [Chloroflexota bacterium]